MKAIVLSAGGMFGAYQAGVWDALAGWFKPDIVVGASVGALNAWAIAGGCPPTELIHRWLHLDRLSSWRLRSRWRPLEGLLNSEDFEDIVQEMHSAFKPQARCGVVVTDALSVKPRLFHDDIQCVHLWASCAVPVLFRQQRIGGRLYTDGGLVQSLPVAAAAEMGATRILAIQVLPCMPSLVVRTAVQGLRLLASKPPCPAGVKVVTIGPGKPIGRVREMLEWKRELAERWIADGRAEAMRNKQSLEEMFGG